MRLVFVLFYKRKHRYRPSERYTKYAYLFEIFYYFIIFSIYFTWTKKIYENVENVTILTLNYLHLVVIIKNHNQTSIHWLDWPIVRKQVNKKTTNDVKSRRWPKTSIWAIFWRFWGQLSPNCNFFWKIGFIQIEGHIWY